MKSDQLNDFLDDGAAGPLDADERAVAKIVRLLGASPAPDSTFLNQLEGRIMSSSPVRGNLVALPNADRLRGGEPRRPTTRALSFAALLAVILVGAGIASLILHVDDGDRPGSGATLPAAMSSPAASPTVIPVYSLSGGVLYAEPTSLSTGLATFAPGTQFTQVSRRQIGSLVWLELRVPNTSIVGWSQALPWSVPNAPSLPNPAFSYLVSAAPPPAAPGVVARVAGPVAAWSTPGINMSMLWTAQASDHLTLTGEQTEQVGASWVRVTRVSDGKPGWIAKDFLFAVQEEATPAYVPVTVVPVASPLPVSRLHSGDAAHVSDDIRVWSQPVPGMQVVWTARKTDELTIIGATVQYNNADWTPIRNVATGQEGWVLSIYLVVPGDSISNAG